MIGSGVLLIRLSSGSRKVNRLLDSSHEVQHPSLTNAVQQLARAERLPIAPIRFVQRLHSPVVVGILRPTVILPEKLLTQLDVDQLRCVLAHELTHVRQRDPLVGLIQRIVEASYWPHPLVHLLNRDLIRAREEVCDNVALHGTTAPHYANTLLKVALGIQSKAPAPGMIGLMTPPWKLEERVKGLLDPRRRLTTTMNTRHLALLAITLATGTALVAGTRVVAAPVPIIPQETVKIVGHVDAATHSVKYKAKTYKPKTAASKHGVEYLMLDKADKQTIKIVSDDHRNKVLHVQFDKPKGGKSKGKTSVDTFTITTDDKDISKAVSKTITWDAFDDLEGKTIIKEVSESGSDPLKGQAITVPGAQDATKTVEKSVTVTRVTNRDGKVETETRSTVTADPFASTKKLDGNVTITQDGDRQITVFTSDADQRVKRYFIDGTVRKDPTAKQDTTLRLFKPGERVKVRYVQSDPHLFSTNPPVERYGALDSTSMNKKVYRFLKKGQNGDEQLFSDDTKLFVTTPQEGNRLRVTADNPTTVYIKGEEIRIVGDRIRVVYVNAPAKQKTKSVSPSKSPVKKKN
jgi:hypothetical protein